MLLKELVKTNQGPKKSNQKKYKEENSSYKKKAPKPRALACAKDRKLMVNLPKLK